MRRGTTLVLFLLLVSADAFAQTGITYRFRENSLVGTVWAAGDDARREIEAGEDGHAAGRVEIWKDGGKQIFVLDPATRTYYEAHAFRARMALGPAASLEPLTARRPFTVKGVKDLKVTLVRTGSEVISGYPCQRATLSFSYTLQTALERVEATVPARVEGTESLCVVPGPGATPLPFGHQAFMSGQPEIDAAVAEQLSALKGTPVARMLKVTRRIETGEPVTATSALLLSDIREATVEAARFEVPKDYRFQEPVVTPPVRK